MAIKVVCGCGAKFNVREELAGRSIECTACGKKVAVPHHVAAGGGGIGKGPVIFGLLLLGAAIAGCGYVIWTQQETIKELQGGLDAQQASLEAQQATLEAQQGSLKAQQGSLDTLGGTLTAARKRLDEVDDLSPEDQQRIANDAGYLRKHRRRETDR